MKIQKSSWHYWLVSKFNNEYDIPNSLCPYMRKIITSTIWAFVSALIACMIVYFFIGSPIVYWLNWFGVIAVAANHVQVGVAAQVIWTVFILGFVANYTHEKWKENYQDHPKKEPGVIMAYISAKKSKFCPSIEFIDEND